MTKDCWLYSALVKFGSACVLLLVLSGCQSLASLAGGTPDYDGTWAGRFQFSSGESGCLKRAGVRVEIGNGDVDGDVSWFNLDRRSGMTGVVKEGGKFVGSASKGTDRYAELDGVFSERTAEGNWKSSRCRGTWTLRKIRNAS